MKREPINRIIRQDILPLAEGERLTPYLTDMLVQGEQLSATSVMETCREMLTEEPLSQSLRQAVHSIYQLAAAELKRTIPQEEGSFAVGDIVYWNINEFDCVKPESIPCKITKRTEREVFAESEDKLHVVFETTDIGDRLTKRPLYQIPFKKTKNTVERE